MKDIIKTPEILPDLFAKKKIENESFQKFIHLLPSKQIDFTLDVIIPEVEKEIDCTQCGNCCRQMQPGVMKDEIAVLASEKNMSVEDFMNDYMNQERGSMIYYMKARPCTFLENKMCSIYASRPSSCAQYPYIDEAQLKLYWRRVMESYKTCPIVFNTVELLKDELGFNSGKE